MPEETLRSPLSAETDGDAEREWKLRVAEERLKEAIQELHLQQQRNRSSLSSSTCDLHPPDESCFTHAIGNLCQSFLLSYGIRVGIGILLRAFKLVRGQSYASLLDIKQLVSEKDLIVREEACRIGLLFGGFTGSYHGLRCLLRSLRRKETPSNAVLAGTLAGLSVLALDGSGRRRTLALYLLARLAQCIYNSAKSKNKFHFWGNRWSHGDSLLFSLACGQVMYAFVMRPESLPNSYYQFILRAGPVSESVYRAVRECCRGSPIDLVSLSAYLSNTEGAVLDKDSSIIPCSIIHPDMPSCIAQNAMATSATFRKTFPLYFSLTFVPFLFLRLNKFLESPVSTSCKALIAAVRSTTFLSAFVGIFQGVICLHRKVASVDHKLLYWFGGGIAGLSVLLEQKSKRGELALYVLPRAGDSLWHILVNRHFLPDIKYAEVGLFCLCMGGIMYYLENEPNTMSPFLRGIIRRFLASRISNQSMSHSSSYSLLQSANPVDTRPRSEQKQDKQAPCSYEKYDLEAIEGL